MSQIEKNETSSLISSDKVEGTAVYNGEGEKLGSIESVMLEKRSGRIAYAVMSFGGFLGMGEKVHPLPWNVLTYDTDKGGYIVPLSKNALKDAPSYDVNSEPGWDDPAWNQQVHGYYQVTPSWTL